MQVLVIGFAEPRFEERIREQLQLLRENDAVRLLDLLVVHKHDDGTVERLHASDLSAKETAEFGTLAAALIGIEIDGETAGEISDQLADAEVWYVDDAIPPGSAAAIAVFEHRWARNLRDEIKADGGFYLADAWVHPDDLAAVGIGDAAMR